MFANSEGSGKTTLICKLSSDVHLHDKYKMKTAKDKNISKQEAMVDIHQRLESSCQSLILLTTALVFAGNITFHSQISIMQQSFATTAQK